MADTGFLYPANTGEDYNQWTSPTNALTSNDIRASINSNNYMQDYYNFSFSIPAGATINGIIVRLEALPTVSTNTAINEVELSWDGGTTYTTLNKQKSFTGAADTLNDFGGATDTFSRTWTIEELSNANFRVRSERIAFSQQVDSISCCIYYTEAGGDLNPSNINVIII
ncbi:hypothetical protein M0R04_15660 [Candidatus Dojkabacteria bacterium]|jgi:hypothetical protein|nr:hypothetical protein [Candidatus Dojkabacteria bacterium]